MGSHIALTYGLGYLVRSSCVVPSSKAALYIGVKLTIHGNMRAIQLQP